MKLSDIKGERTIDLIANLIEPIANIAEDDEAVSFFKKKPLPDGMNPKKFMLQRAKKSLPALLKSHKKDIITILSSIEGTSYDEYAKTLNLGKLTMDFADLMTDKAITELFISAQTENSSGPARENTEGVKA